jgi:high-affinity Fe2+/Pb2+ permease
MPKRKGSFNPRQHWQQTQTRLLIGGMLTLLVVGGGLVWVIYGRAAALTTAACLLATGGVMGLLWLILAVLERWVKDDEG